ncbi:MAG: OmpA family protein [Sideroxydans sp.]|nr:OmpA family protein [Sideroxydans sp.]
MSKLLLSLFLSISCVAIAAPDPAPANLQQIEELQRRADKLAFGEVGSDNYHLAKARAWLDMALSEYHQTDSSGTMYAAIAQAQVLLDAIEAKQPNISMDTPQDLQGTETVRPDLWEQIAEQKKNMYFKCSQRQIAEAEVQLVWTGHEKKESGWSHAESYARGVENLLYEAKTNGANCDKAQQLADKNAGKDKAVKDVQKLALSGDALFVFGTDKLLPGADESLNKLATEIKSWVSIQSILLVGYTDRLRSDGNEAKNRKLSDDRAERVKKYLVEQGIPAAKISAQGGGSSKPVVLCSNKESKAKQIACLQPNRRVEITLRGEK